MDIVRIAQRMEELLAAAGVENGDIRVTVDRGTTKVRYGSAAEAAEGLPDADLTKLEDIALQRTDFTGMTVAVFFFKRATVLLVEGSGDDHIKVAGIADDLAAEIERHGAVKPPPHWQWVYAALALAIIGLLAGSVLASGTLARVLSIGVFVPYAGAVWLTVRVFTPKREILAEGESSRSERIRGFILRFADRAVMLAAGAALGVLVKNWFD
jgi:hypothetical protein